jgi:ADP-heptose:LPS heptosyltransferase
MSMNSAASELIESDNPRVCVLFPGALGDFVCFLPALRQLAGASAVDLFARSEFAAIAPHGVTVHSLERSEVRQLFIDGGAADRRVIELFSEYTAIYSWFASRQMVFVEQLRTLAQQRAHIFAFQPNDMTVHQADYYLSCLNLIAQESAVPVVALRTEAMAWCDLFYRRKGIGSEPLLMVAPSSGSTLKNWPEAYFDQVALWWSRHVGGKVILVLGPVEAERGSFERLSSSCLVASGLDLAQLAALIARCAVYVGNDSGVTHLAAAVGARTIAIFGPSNEQRWAPRGARVSILRHQIACSPCGESAMERCPHRSCLAELFPSEVIYELRKLPEIGNLTRLGAGITV